MHYLDNAATTMPYNTAVQAVSSTLTAYFANPSSLYAAGFESEKLLNKARQRIARVMHTHENELIFTSSGSEANHIAIMGATKARMGWGKHIVATAFEHPSVQNTIKALENEGFAITLIKPEQTGEIDENKLLNAVTKNTALVCAMHVNNETGAILDIKKIASQVKAINNRTAMHVDGVQAFCKLPINLNDTKIDTYSVSGHKVHAPKGVGALYIRKGFNIYPVLFGGGQEKGLRPGTENVAYAQAFAIAAERASAEFKLGTEISKDLSRLLWNELSKIDNIQRNSPENACCHIANFSLMNIKSETMLHYLDAKGVCVSSGSACGRGAKSHTLLAMGLSERRIDTALRVSFCNDNTREDVFKLIECLKAGIEELAKIGG